MPRIGKQTVRIPKPHKAQQDALASMKGHRYVVLACGRRWGKSLLTEYLAARSCIAKKHVAYAAPTYAMTKAWFRSMVHRLGPLIKSVNTQHARIELHTGGSIQCFTLDAPTSIRGNAFDLFIVDEAAFCSDLMDVWDNIIRPTLIDRRGRAMMVSSPNGFNDFWQFYEKDDEEWISISMPSWTNPYLPKDEVNKMKTSMPSWVFESEIAAKFIEVKSNLFRREWIQRIDPDEIPKELTITFGVDLAISKKSSADMTAICILGTDPVTNVMYILGMIRERLSMRETLQRIISLASEFNPVSIAVESVAYQAAVSDELIESTSLPVIPVNPSTDKVTRSIPAITRFERGLIYTSTSALVDPEFLTELMAFPSTRIHDDTIDAMNLAMHAVNSAQTFYVFSI